MQFIEIATRLAFAVASLGLMALALLLIGFAGSTVWFGWSLPDANLGNALLEAVGYTVIAIAVFDVGKYLLEEEAIRGREMRHAGEARRSLTKFLSTIIIAVLLEGLVAVFEAGKEDMRMMLYPTFLLLVGVLMIVALGVFQRLSASVERDVNDPPDKTGRPPTLAQEAAAEAKGGKPEEQRP